MFSSIFTRLKKPFCFLLVFGLLSLAFMYNQQDVATRGISASEDATDSSKLTQKYSTEQTSSEPSNTFSTVPRKRFGFRNRRNNTSSLSLWLRKQIASLQIESNSTQLNRRMNKKRRRFSTEIPIHFHGFYSRDFKYQNISRLLRATSDDIIAAPKPSFLMDVRNPCFAVTRDSINPINATLADATRFGWDVLCLPYTYLLGFTKCATTDLFSYMVKFHECVVGAGKELHWWDNMHHFPGTNIYFLAEGLMSGAKLIQRPDMLDAKSYQTPMQWQQCVIAEGTPRTVWHGDFWQYDIGNAGRTVPQVLVPHKLHHLTPQARLIVIMRDPTARLLSDYNYYVRRGRERSSEDFHEKVVRAIAWWRECESRHPLRQCLYGPSPSDMPALDIDYCIYNRDKLADMKVNKRQIGTCYDKVHWSNNTAGRLRVGLYEAFLQDWLSVFPREQMLFIKFEEFIENRADTITTQVYPFLDVSDVKGGLVQKLNEVDNEGIVHNSSRNKVAMLPETRALLNDFYGFYNKRLAKVLKDKKWIWGTDS